MTVKEVWTESDFENMGWHDSHIYTVHLPNNNLQLKLDIDYIFRWELSEATGFYKFWVSPCSLVFLDVSNVSINLDIGNETGVDIMDINRTNPRLSENGKMTIWYYSMETDKGVISFDSSGYIQSVIAQPKFIDGQALGRR